MFLKSSLLDSRHVRTKGQQENTHSTHTGNAKMIETIRTTMSRADNSSLVTDMIGAVSLIVILVGALHLPLL